MPTTRKRASSPFANWVDQRCAGLHAERGGQALADLGLARPGGAATGRELRRLEPQPVAAVGDQLERLAELVRVGDVGGEPLRGGADAGNRADRVQRARRSARRQLIALAQGAGVVLERVERRRQRQHQQDHRAGRGEHGRGGERSHRPRRRPSASPGRWPPTAARGPEASIRRSRRAASRRRAGGMRARRARRRRRPPPRRPRTGRSPSGPSSDHPAGNWSSASSRRSAGPRAASVPTSSPSSAAGSATSTASAAVAATIALGDAPSARSSANDSIRRSTSTREEAASITTAPARATSEKATSSAMTMPAAWSIWHADGVPGREHEAADAEARRPRLLQRDVQPVAVVHPDQRLVHGLPGIRRKVRGDHPVGHPHPGRAGQRVGDVVGRDSDADDAQALGRDRWGGRPEADGVAGLEVPLLGQPLLDHRLAGAVAQVAAGDDVIAAPTRLHPLQLPAGDLGVPVRPQVDAPLLVPVGDAGYVGQRTAPARARCSDRAGRTGRSRRAGRRGRRPARSRRAG